MNREFHIFIIWSNAYKWKDKIITDILLRFRILGIHTVIWDKNRFSKNLTRFYGENLPKNSNKEKHCGNGPFTLVTVIDEKPLYRLRKTSKGMSVVNVNMFDSKEMYRSWTGGGHLIHSTNSVFEARHDVVLLTGYSDDDYLKMYESNGSKVLCQEFTHMPGELSWESTEKMFYVLNETVTYVVLRNFDNLFSVYKKGFHGDIDILTNNYYLTQLALNAKTVHKSKYRVQNIVNVQGIETLVDIRHVGDHYYCTKWEDDFIATREKDAQNFYKPSKENFEYGLLYHALLQKKKISQDYFVRFLSVFPKLSETDDSRLYLLENLEYFMQGKGYNYCEPDDYTVYLDQDATKIRMSKKRFILKAYHKVFG